jgi:hypothetical protein
MAKFVTNREITIMYRGQADFPNWEGVELHIPKGHPVVRLVGGQSVRYCSDNPGALLDKKTQGTLLHDATYYGITIPSDAVSEV